MSRKVGSAVSDITGLLAIGFTFTQRFLIEFGIAAKTWKYQ